MNKLFNLLIIAIFCGCVNNSKTEKYQDERDNVINVRDKVKAIEIKDVMISNIFFTYVIDKYLIIADYESPVEFLHIFDKNTFKYISSRVFRGRGPREIIRLGHIGIDEANRVFYITDGGKHSIFRYDIDSLLADSRYMPTVAMKTKASQAPSKYQYINDTLSIGRIMAPINNGSDFKPSVGTWNMKTGEIKLMKYQHPDIKKKRILCAASMEDGIYVECYPYYDLMTICSLNGDLKYNIYGPNWSTQVTSEVKHFDQVSFYKDKIFALYLGGDRLFLDKNKQTRVNRPTKFLVFDLNGNYIKTLETGRQIMGFSLDKENNRFILELEDSTQFAYLDLDGLLD